MKLDYTPGCCVRGVIPDAWWPFGFKRTPVDTALATAGYQTASPDDVRGWLCHPPSGTCHLIWQSELFGKPRDLDNPFWLPLGCVEEFLPLLRQLEDWNVSKLSPRHHQAAILVWCLASGRYAQEVHHPPRIRDLLSYKCYVCFGYRGCSKHILSVPHPRGRWGGLQPSRIWPELYVGGACGKLEDYALQHPCAKEVLALCALGGVTQWK